MDENTQIAERLKDELRLDQVPEDFMERIKKNLSIVKVAKKLTTLEGQGHYWSGPCPFCPYDKCANDRTPFAVYEDEKRFHCFKCRLGGDVFALVSMREDRPLFYAVKYLLSNFGKQECGF